MTNETTRNEGTASAEANASARTAQAMNGDEPPQELETSEGTAYRSRVPRGESIIRRNVYWAMGAGVLPLPLLDFAAITGVQMKMLKELSELYDIEFASSRAKQIVYALLTGLGSVGLGGMVGFSLAKFIPALGTSLGIVSVPLFAGALTHAIGKSFLMHFDRGGTFLDFDAQAMRSYFKGEYERAKKTVASMKREGAVAND